MEVEDALLLGPELVRETTEKVNIIQECIKTAQSHQKSYANRKCKGVELNVGDFVFLKVLPMKGIMRFGKKSKLAPRLVGPYEIIERIGNVAYKLALPPALAKIHNVFHVSLLRKCVQDPSQIVSLEVLENSDDLTYVVRSVTILDQDVKQLRCKKVNLVKVQWSENENDITWELEEKMSGRARAWGRPQRGGRNIPAQLEIPPQ
ncbi:uncharacterized protein LOC114295703 [Camellia sinensis]|uniref:uncharacterized protein LOC114295703 n=1 Tax=Camellia sinensis TaxID=4442 RepID=UPI0010365003|nr:uncharacterized protein LOC114295703 [Camellia sinensis]